MGVPRSELPRWEDIQFVTAQLHKLPLLDDEAVNSCMVLAVEADGSSVLTIEGLLGTDGELHPLQKAFVKHGAIQCGYCTSGVIIAAKVLLDQNPHPTEKEISEAISGNLCRCTGYGQIVEAIQIAATRMQTEPEGVADVGGGQ